MSIYIPAEYQETGGAKDFADSLIDMVEKFETDHPDKFDVVSSIDEVLAAKAAGKVALPLGIENGAAVEDDLANLEHFFNRGVRYITLTHSKNNQICDSSYEEPDNRKWNGLSPFGKEVVAEMNRLGIMIDISHVSDDAFYQVMELSQAPAIASHSSCRHFTPGFERNMDDEMIRKLAENGGVIQINFGSEELNAYIESYREQNPFPYATLDDVVAHIDHVVKLVGIDHVGLGSDYDGVGDSLPEGLKDVSEFPNLIEALLVKGYSDEDIEKILSGNVIRVWKAVEAKAAELQAQS
ncbi:putative dipeptidase CPSG_01350 [Exaiptasia diaphana]|uniref:Dipeptidase n=1 Tax=Exaiptasia diaphana TaxID=2652724 RepID=A0A913XQ32_EXADI|nr:putative dipeptidase CPSG_01350 [Exaiptasia diaphana]